MNKVIILGRMTKDVELQHTQSDKAVCSFTVAVNRRTKDKEGKYEADFINCQAWDKLAEFISQYFHKGDAIALVGRLQTRTWDDNDGKKHYVTEVVVSEVYFAGKKVNGENQSPAQEQAVPSVNNNAAVEDEDDLPF